MSCCVSDRPLLRVDESDDGLDGLLMVENKAEEDGEVGFWKGCQRGMSSHWCAGQWDKDSQTRSERMVRL